MAEIKKDIIYVREIAFKGENIEGFLVQEENTIADIARWIIQENWQDEILYFLNNPESL
jgi:hypothetical protein